MDAFVAKFKRGQGENYIRKSGYWAIPIHGPWWIWFAEDVVSGVPFV